jgi:hypothetical protein
VAITWADVTAIAPELSTVANGSQTAILADVALLLNASALGSKFDMASKYLAAHLGTVASRPGGEGGPVVSDTVGPLSRSFAPPGFTDPYYASTPYGVEFQRIIRTIPALRLFSIC